MGREDEGATGMKDGKLCINLGYTKGQHPIMEVTV